MSQRHFKTTFKNLYTKKTSNVNVMMGYDRPLKYFFMVIENLDDDNICLYSNLDEDEAHKAMSQGLEHYLSVLKSMNIIIPNEMIEAVLQDRINEPNQSFRHWLDENSKHHVETM